MQNVKKEKNKQKRKTLYGDSNPNKTKPKTLIILQAMHAVNGASGVLGENQTKNERHIQSEALFQSKL